MHLPDVVTNPTTEEKKEKRNLKTVDYKLFQSTSTTILSVTELIS